MLTEDERRKYVDGIQRTGFPLENQVATAFKSRGWTVVSNRYYLDDVEGRARELDLLAYRSDETADFRVYTSVLVSCKRSTERAWALLSRKRDQGNRNYNWKPLHVWTNSTAVEFEVRGIPQTAANLFYIAAAGAGVRELFRIPAHEIFAVQELAHGDGMPKNDSKIFESISTLMKAQAYESTVLQSRRKERSVYQFNLLSVVDARLVRLHFGSGGGAPSAIETEQEHYLSRYIVNGVDMTARILLVSPTKLEGVISDYSRLHACNVEWFKRRNEYFYQHVLSDPTRRNVLIGEFRQKVVGAINYVLKEASRVEVTPDQIRLDWYKKAKKVVVFVDTDAEGASALSEDNYATGTVRLALRDLYRYRGDWYFSDDVPF